MKVVPLSATTVNWDAYILAIKEVLGVVPTRTLDSKGLNITSLLALPLIMGNDSRIDYAVLESSTRLDHIFCSFLVISDNPLTLSNMTDLSIFAVHNDRKRVVGIISGTVSKWREAIYRVLHYGGGVGVCDNSSDEVIIFKEIHSIFCRIGASQLWSGKWLI